MTKDELDAAMELVHRFMPATPQYTWPLLSEALGCEVWVKHENHSRVGAFKLRGGIVYLDRLRREQPAVRGIVAATRGNHGQSLVYASGLFGFQAVIVVPHGNSEEKNAAMRALGAELIITGDDFQEAFEAAGRIALERGLHMVPSFDPMLVRGVATYAGEMFQAMPAPDAVYVAIGMGSGCCGVLAAREALGVKTSVVGVVAAAAPSHAISLREGRLVEAAVSTRIADGMACRRPDQRALDTMTRSLDRVVEVTDDEIEAAMRLYFTATHNVAEGAGAAALAGALQECSRLAGKRVALILSGGNVDRAQFARVLSA
jgi:threonine dehydratase